MNVQRLARQSQCFSKSALWRIRPNENSQRGYKTIAQGRISRFQRPVRRGPPLPKPQSQPKRQERRIPKNEIVSNALRATAEGPDNRLLAPVHIPEDRHAIIRESHPATGILANSTLVVQRQLEMMNVLVGFEQANRYIVMDPHGNHVGFLAEQEHGIGSALVRQAFRTHRSFTTHVFDRNEREVLRFHRPFSWINSRIRVYDAVVGGEVQSVLNDHGAEAVVKHNSSQISSSPISSMRLIGETQQQWAPLRRKYNLFLHRPDAASQDAAQLTSGDLPLVDSKAVVPITVGSGTDRRTTGVLSQFAYVNEPFLSWDFGLVSADNNIIGSVNRNFSGFAREIFTDTGVYALRMDSESLAAEPSRSMSETAAQAAQNQALGMTLDQRAVMLATAVSIDFDYFSRHSHAGGGWLMPPIWIGGGGEAAGGGAAAGGAAGGVAEGAAAEAGTIGARGVNEAAARNAGGMYGAGEGAIAGAGTMAGYEAMQRGFNRPGPEAEVADPRLYDSHGSSQSSQPPPPPPPAEPSQQEEIWGEGDWFNPPNNSSNEGQNPPGPGSPGGVDGGGGEGGSGVDGDWFGDFF